MAKVKEVPGRLLSTRWCCRELPLWGRAGCPGIPTGENQPEAGGSPQGPASWPSTGRGAQTYSHPTMRSSIFGSNYREYRKPQLSSLFVFPGQRHSPYRATAGTWVKYSMVKHPHDEDRPPSPGLPREVVGLDDPHWFPPRQLTVPSPKKPHPPDFWGSRGPPPSTRPRTWSSPDPEAGPLPSRGHHLPAYKLRQSPVEGSAVLAGERDQPPH